jgi:hypothetical protein
MLQQIISLFSNNQLTTTTPPPPAPRPTPPANPDPEVETVMSQEEYCSVSQQHTMCTPQVPKLIYFSLIYFPKVKVLNLVQTLLQKNKNFIKLIYLIITYLNIGRSLTSFKICCLAFRE